MNEESSCVQCDEIDDMDMVQCDECDEWAHYRCVGVGPEIQDEYWCCRFCDASSIGLSLTDAPREAVDAAVGVESQIFVSRGTGNEIIFKPIEEDADLNPTHLRLYDEATYNFYEDTLAKYRGVDMHDTVREVAQNMISDKVLMEYSYCGRGRHSPPFKTFYNVTNVIITATVESINRAYRQRHKKNKTETEEEKEEFYKQVENYFTKEYIKKAKTRYNQTKD